MSNFYLEINAGDSSDTMDDRHGEELARTEFRHNVGDISITRSKHTHELLIDSPLTTADQLYYRSDAGRLCISNDLRRLVDQSCTLSEAGIYSILQFGTIAPTAELWNEVREFKPGVRSKISVGDKLATEESADDQPDSMTEDFTMDIRDQKAIVCSVIDEILVDACPTRNPVILFSGGVDSTLMAARAAKMGWYETTLVNLSFGPDDTESQLAEKLAKILGLDFVRVNALDYDSLAVLDEGITRFSRPFGDPSTSPTYTLITQVIDQFPGSRPILDGTGADGAFGLASKLGIYRMTESMPHFVLASVSAFYKSAGLWKRNTVFERPGRIVRRCAQLPTFLAAIARNPLADIAYEVTSRTQDHVLDEIDKWISQFCTSGEIGLKVPVADLAINCSRVLAQKTKSPFDLCGRTVKYPFLDERMIRLAMGRARHWPHNNEPKWILKALLADFVPSDMVYRQKSGFVGPYREILSRRKFVSSLDRLIEEGVELRPYLSLDVIKALRTKVISNERLPGQTYWFIWAAVFLNNWFTVNARPKQ